MSVNRVSRNDNIIKSIYYYIMIKYILTSYLCQAVFEVLLYAKPVLTSVYSLPSARPLLFSIYTIVYCLAFAEIKEKHISSYRNILYCCTLQSFLDILRNPPETIQLNKKKKTIKNWHHVEIKLTRNSIYNEKLGI